MKRRGKNEYQQQKALQKREKRKLKQARKDAHSRPRTWAALVALVAAATVGSVASQAPAIPEPEPAPTSSSAPTLPPIEEVVTSPGVPETFEVLRVVDGDTIHVDYRDERMVVRILGLDTPETVHPTQPVECYGPEASAEAKDRLAGEKVTLVVDPSQGSPSDKFEGMRADYFGRVLAYVELEGMDFGRHMIQHGLAKESTHGRKHVRADEYRQVEATAESFGIGMHGAC